MNAAGTTNVGQDGTDDRPVRLVLPAYLVVVLQPLIGLLAGALLLARPGGWVKRQGAAIIAISVILLSLGIGLGAMLVESYYGAREQRELNAVSSETQRADVESERELERQLAQVRREGAATQARLRALKERNAEPTARGHR